MSPSDKTKTAGVLVHGSIHHFTRKAGRLVKCRRWAYVNQDSLLIFPDAYTSSHCYRLLLTGADVNISYEDEDNPLIAITEPDNTITYLIQPEKPYKFQKWLSAIYKASRSPSEGLNTNSNLTSGGQASLFSANGTLPVPSDVPDFTVIPKQRTHQLSMSHRNHVDQTNPTQSERTKSINPPAVPKRIALPWDCKSHRGHKNHSKTQNSQMDNQWTPVPPARSTKRVPFSQVDGSGQQPPPRPPRSGIPLKTVKEHPDMRDSDIVPTKSLDEVKSRYPVSGLAKRMSISASDLLGKSRDELILLLLQLNREKANLQRWHDYFTRQIDLIRSSKRDSADANKDIEAIEVELKDVNGQLSLSEPLVTFLSNMLRMGDLYGGDDVLFASEYRQHLLSPHEIVPPKPSLTLAREVEAREVARSLNASKRKMTNPPKPATRSSTVTDQSCTLANWIAQSDRVDWASGPSRIQENSLDRSVRRRSTDVDFNYVEETASMRRRREQLEAELADLEELCAPHSEIHQRLRETQRALRSTEHSSAKMQGSISHASGPSAALLRRLRADQYSGQRRPRTDSTRARSRSGPDEEQHHVEEWLDPTRQYSESFRRGTNDSGRTTPRRRNQSASGRSQQFTPIQDPGDFDSRNESLRRYRSIPDHLNLMKQDESVGLSELTRQKSFEWEPLNRPLNMPRPLPESSQKFAALQPEVFVYPSRANTLYLSNYSQRVSRREPDQSREPLSRLETLGRDGYLPEPGYGITYTPSDRLFREWSQPLVDPSDRFQRHNSLKPNTDSMPNKRSIFGYSNERIDRTLDPDLMDNGDIPRVVRAYNSNTNELRPNYSSPDLTRLPDAIQFGKSENELFEMTDRPTPRNRASIFEYPNPAEEDVNLVFTDLKNRRYSPSACWNGRTQENVTRSRKSSTRLQSPYDGSHTIQLLNRNPWESGISSRGPGSPSSIDTESTTKEPGRELTSPVKPFSHSIDEWLKMESPPASGKPLVNGDRSVHTPELLQMNLRRDGDFPSDHKSPDQWRSPVAERQNIHDEFEQPVFSPPEPMKIQERYVPSPPQGEPTDMLLRQSKEMRLNAIREVLLRQRLIDSYDHRDSPPNPTSTPSRDGDRINQNVHLISMQAKLAKDAVASVFQLAGTLNDGIEVFPL
ncbi:unnamed protein product [Echinostoma caproni]|uniref:PH domain-containing protein n=1 Tax=Echinostoma caproni TaxID=27848 RepID=A0A183A838_9TREM|nr:unnamed protein product [Echinostoma caproni]